MSEGTARDLQTFIQNKISSKRCNDVEEIDFDDMTTGHSPRSSRAKPSERAEAKRRKSAADKEAKAQAKDSEWSESDLSEVDEPGWRGNNVSKPKPTTWIQPGKSLKKYAAANKTSHSAYSDGEPYVPLGRPAATLRAATATTRGKRADSGEVIDLLDDDEDVVVQESLTICGTKARSSRSGGSSSDSWYARNNHPTTTKTTTTRKPRDVRAPRNNRGKALVKAASSTEDGGFVDRFYGSADGSLSKTRSGRRQQQQQFTFTNVEVCAGIALKGTATLKFNDTSLILDGLHCPVSINYKDINFFKVRVPEEEGSSRGLNRQPEVVSLIDDDDDEEAAPAAASSDTSSDDLLLAPWSHFVALRTRSMLGLQSLRPGYDSEASTVGREGPRAHIILKMEAAALKKLIQEVVFRESPDNDLASPLAELCGYISAQEAPEYLHGVKQARKDARDEEAKFVAELNTEIVLSGDTRGLRRSTRATNKRTRPLQAEADLSTAFKFPTERFAADVLTLVNADRLRLFEGEFLNDSLINCFFKHHVGSCLDSEMVKSAHVFSTFFFTKMLEAESERHTSGSNLHQAAFEKVQRWVRNIDVFSKSVLFIPVNQHLHWSLAVVCNPGAPALQPRRRRRSPTSIVLEEEEDVDVVVEEEQQEEKKPSSPSRKAGVIDLTSESEDEDEPPIQRNRRKKQPAAAPAAEEEEEEAVVVEEEEEVDLEESRKDAPCILMMDSLTAHDAKYVSKYIRNFLRCAWNDRKDAPPLDGRFEEASMPHIAPSLPDQNNTVDCGVFVLKYFEVVFANLPLRISPKMIHDRDLSLGGTFKRGLFTRREVRDKRAWFLKWFDDRKEEFGREAAAASSSKA